MKVTLHGRNLERGQISRATERKDQRSGRFRCVLRLITRSRASSKVHISCNSKSALLTFLARVSSTLGGSFSSNSSFLFALHSLIPWVLLNPLLDFSDFRANRPLASRTSRRLSSVPLASADVPGELSSGLFMSSELYSTPPTINSVPGALHDRQLPPLPSLFSSCDVVDRSMNWACFLQTGDDKWIVLRSTVFSTLFRDNGNTFCNVFRWIAPRRKESEDKRHTSCAKLREAIFYLFSLRLTFKRWRARAIFVPMPRAPNNYMEPP